MADLMTRWAMANDDTLRPRVFVAMIRLAIDVISEPALGDDTPPLERAAHARRREYALDVTRNAPNHAARSQFALACWGDLADTYAAGGAEAITDEQITESLVDVWTATGGG